MSVAEETRLLERERELAVLDSLTSAVAGGQSRLLVVIGAAGIGKTRLLAALRRRAESARLRVLRAAGVEFERGLSFAGVTQLFQAPLQTADEKERARLLSGAARLGGDLLGFGTRPFAEIAGDPGFAAIHGLYWLCANLATSLPLVILVDDAHWLDPQSAGWIEYLARRLEGLSVLIAVATRPEGEIAQRLVRSAIETQGEIIELQPLSQHAVHRILNTALDQPVQRTFEGAFQESTGGNPFLVEELLRTIREEGIEADANGARVVQTLGSDRIARAVLLRLHRLSPASVELARAVAILGRAGSLTIAARLAQLDEETATHAAEMLTAAEVLAKGTPLRFHHPVVRASIYYDLPAAARGLRHRQAARLLHDTRAPLAAVASQLLEAEPVGDPWTISVLREAAAETASSGAPTTAMTLLERALGEVRESRDSELLLELGGTALAALEIPKAVDALTQARDCSGPTARAVATLQLARALLHAGRPREAVGLLKEEIANASALEPDLRIWLELEYVLYAAPDPDGLQTARRFRSLPGRKLPELAALAAASSVADTANEAAALAQRALAAGTLVRALDTASTWFLAPWMLIRADHLDEAADAIAQALEYSRTTGSQAGFARSSWLHAELEHRKGALLSAEAHAQSAYTIAAEGGSLWMRLMSGSLLGQVLADRGELSRAHEVLDELDTSMLHPNERLAWTVQYARANMTLLAGSPQQAVIAFEHLREAFRAAPNWRARFATGLAPYATALSSLGRIDEARQAAADELAWAESWGTPRFIGIALHTHAHARDNAERIKSLRRATAVLERAPARLELARTLADLGSTLRRQNQRAAAREPLRQALDLARRCRADALADHVRGELRAAGAKPRRDLLTGTDALTASEARIAEMAASGMTNAQIAQAIFLTPGTIEKHLTSVYAKLGITSRHQLASALGPQPESQG